MADTRKAIENDHASRVREMFATIAGRYDLLNHLLSGQMDKRWRRVVATRLGERLQSNEAVVLDVACGTGDLSLELFETIGARVVATDFCRPMLDIAARKVARETETSGQSAILLVEGDALSLPFQNDSFDGATIAFGLRNLANVERGLAELLRVLKPGGSLAILEFSKPVIPGFNFLFQVYFTKLLPFVGGVISGSRSAYQYLPDSVAKFPDQKELVERMQQAGFERVEYLNLTGGIAALHLGTRPQ